MIRAPVIMRKAYGRDVTQQANQTSVKVPSVTTKTCVTLVFDLYIIFAVEKGKRIKRGQGADTV